MPNRTLLQVPSMTNTNIARFKSGCDIALARGFGGVRASAGMGGYGGSATISAASLAVITECVTYAANLGLGKLSFLTGYSPDPNGTYLKSLNGGNPITVQSRPPAGTGNGIWIALGTYKQQIIDTCRAAAIAAGKDPTTFLEEEDANEWNKGGVSGPKNASGVYAGVYGTSMHYGAIENDWFVMANTVRALVNAHSIPICSTLEGDTSDSDRTTDSPPPDGIKDYIHEVNSWAGSDATNYLATLTSLNFNKYASAPGTPYDATAVKSAFSTKLTQQTDLMAANAVIGAKAVNLREFGIKQELAPPCTAPNTIRNDLISQVKAQAGIGEGCLYLCYNLSGISSVDQKFYCYEQNGTPQQPYNVHISA